MKLCCVLLLIALAASVSARAQEDSVRAEEPTPLVLNGTIGVATAAYSSSGIEARRTPFSWTLTGTVSASVSGWTLPLNFTVSEQERSYRQPYNQFGLTPSYGPLTAQLGYGALNFSRYTLSGVQFLGAGAEWKPGAVRLGAMVGRLQRAVEEDSTNVYNLPAYERTGYAFKLGVGSDESHVDLSLLRATDDTNSLRHRPVVSTVTPSDNLVVGLSGLFTLMPELQLDFEGAVSAFTRDLRSPSINIDSSDIPSFLSDYFPPNISSTLSFATRAGISGGTRDYGLRIGWERVEPDFTSLGTYYLLSDIESWTLEPRATMFDNTLRVFGAIGIQHDNLLGMKLARTNRVIGSGSVSWAPGQTFGVDAAFTNMTTRQVAGRVPLDDSVAVHDVNMSLSLAPRLLFPGEDFQHYVAAVLSLQQYTDQNAFTAAYTNTDATTISLLYNLAFVKQMASLGASLTFTDAKTGSYTAQMVGGSLNGNTVLFDNVLSLGLTLGYAVTTSDPGSTTTNTVNETLNGSVHVTDRDAITFAVHALQNSGSSGDNARFSEVLGTLGYSRALTWSP